MSRPRNRFLHLQQLMKVIIPELASAPALAGLPLPPFSVLAFASNKNFFNLNKLYKRLHKNGDSGKLFKKSVVNS